MLLTWAIFPWYQRFSIKSRFETTAKMDSLPLVLIGAFTPGSVENGSWRAMNTAKRKKNYLKITSNDSKFDHKIIFANTNRSLRFISSTLVPDLGVAQISQIDRCLSSKLMISIWRHFSSSTAPIISSSSLISSLTKAIWKKQKYQNELSL